jgi:hypothetical protein
MVTRHDHLNAACSGSLSLDLVVAMGILVLGLLPLSFLFAKEQQLARTYYHRAAAMAIVDGEMEILAAGGWRAFDEGTHVYATRAETATNLPPGDFVLTREGDRLRLEWIPEGKPAGRIARETTIGEQASVPARQITP